MTRRRDLIDLLSREPRSLSSIAREMGLGRGDVEEDLRHALRSAAAQDIVSPCCRRAAKTAGSCSTNSG